MKRGFGLILIVIAVAVGGWYAYTQRGGKDVPGGSWIGIGGQVETVVIRYGSEKKGFLNDEDVKKILRKRYGVEVEGTKMGSLEMSEGSLDGLDALWPSSELAAAVFASRHASQVFKKANIFSSPIVFFSWPKITEALVQAGIVQQREKVYYVIDLKRFLEAMLAEKTWKSLGLPYQAGNVNVRCTDPRKSNSGFLLSGLLAIVLNGGQMVDTQSIKHHLPTLKNIFKSMGYMENSSGILFDKYIKQGQGAFPVVSNYESLMVEFYNAHPDKGELIRKNVYVLIPEPTVWSEHPLIALNDVGNKLMEALQDDDIIRLAWKRYGLRPGVLGGGMDSSILRELRLPDQIQAATPLPAIEVMEMILKELH
ncbi:MAG: hypothetical protein PVH42_20350 [Desulfobacterales bacterium]|jgi:hypothetical protein